MSEPFVQWQAHIDQLRDLLNNIAHLREALRLVDLEALLQMIEEILPLCPLVETMACQQGHYVAMVLASNLQNDLEDWEIEGVVLRKMATDEQQTIRELLVQRLAVIRQGRKLLVQLEKLTEHLPLLLSLDSPVAHSFPLVWECDPETTGEQRQEEGNQQSRSE